MMAPPTTRRRVFVLWGSWWWGQPTTSSLVMRFRVRSWREIVDAAIDGVGWFMEGTVYLIGPLLILLALGIMGLLTYTWGTILIPMWQDKYRHSEAYWRTAVLMLHATAVALLLGNILFNYWHCVRTRHKGPEYDAVVRELAGATGFVYPETPDQVQMFRREFEDLMVLRMRRRQVRAMEREQQQQQRQMQLQQQQQQQPSTLPPPTSSGAVQRRHDPSITSAEANGVGNGSTSASEDRNGRPLPASTASSQPPPAPAPLPAASVAAPPPPLRRWMLLGPFEWGYCGNSHQPKPPRSHYDHVSQTLVLNLDHYCPWMFNSIGYFNYRYFICFLAYVFLGMIYGGLVTYEPFMLLGTLEYRRQYAMDRHQPPPNVEAAGSASAGSASARQLEPVAAVLSTYALSGQPIPARLRPMLPFAQERMLLTLSFMMCVALGCAVLILGGFHLYLIGTGQTTIEFHANWSLRRRDPKHKNPYSLGSWRKNVEQVLDTPVLWRALLPRKHPPTRLPVPLPGRDNRRRPNSQHRKDDGSVESTMPLRDAAWVV